MHPGAELSGKVVGGRYRLGPLIGQGAMGAVYEATQEALGRAVAVKVLLPQLAEDATHVARFKAEAALAGSLSHPHVVQVHDFGAEEGTVWIAMERLEGESLRTRVERDGPMRVHDALSIAVQMLRGLEAAHSRQLVHRDLKPDNVFLARTPGMGEVVKLVDFGIAKLLDSQNVQKLTATGMMVGTPLYMAPEQITGGEVDARADVHGAGAVLFEMLAGRPPREAATYHALVHAILTAPPAPLASLRPDVDPRVGAIIERALATDPAARWPSAAAMREQLERVLADAPATGAAAGASPLVPATRVSPSVAAATPHPGGASAERSWGESPAASAGAAVPTPTAMPVEPRGRSWLPVALGGLVAAVGIVVAVVAVASVWGGGAGEDALRAETPVATDPPQTEPLVADPSKDAGSAKDAAVARGEAEDAGRSAARAETATTARTNARRRTSTSMSTPTPSESGETTEATAMGTTAATERQAREPTQRVRVRYSSITRNPMYTAEQVRERARPIVGDDCWSPAGFPFPESNWGDCYDITSNAEGVVTNVNVVSPHLDERPPGFYQCMYEKLRTIRFDPPEGPWGTTRVCWGLDR